MPPDAGSVLHVFGETVIMHLDSGATGGTLNLWTEITPPGGGPPAHYHEHEDECYAVQEGRVAFFAEERWREFGPGAVVFMPRRQIHAFKNVGDAQARLLIVQSPGGVIEKYMEEAWERIVDPSNLPPQVEPDFERVMTVMQKYGIEVLPPT